MDTTQNWTRLTKETMNSFVQQANVLLAGEFEVTSRSSRFITRLEGPVASAMIGNDHLATAISTAHQSHYIFSAYEVGAVPHRQLPAEWVEYAFVGDELKLRSRSLVDDSILRQRIFKRV